MPAITNPEVKYCKRCDADTPRNNQGRCIPHKQEDAKKWKHTYADTDEVRARMRKWYCDNREEQRAKAKVFYQTNKERLKEVSRQFREDNPDLCKLRGLRYARKLKEELIKYKGGAKCSVCKTEDECLPCVRTLTVGID